MVLASDLSWVAAGLPDVVTMATVLMGSGSDNMHPSDAVDAFLHGLADACRDGRAGGHLLSTVRIVEWQFDRAMDALDVLVATCDEPVEGTTFQVRADLVRSGSGGTSDEFSLALALASVGAGRATGGITADDRCAPCRCTRRERSPSRGTRRAGEIQYE